MIETAKAIMHDGVPIYYGFQLVVLGIMLYAKTKRPLPLPNLPEAIVGAVLILLGPIGFGLLLGGMFDAHMSFIRTELDKREKNETNPGE